jgi:hypothetical protein
VLTDGYGDQGENKKRQVLSVPSAVGHGAMYSGARRHLEADWSGETFENTDQLQQGAENKLLENSVRKKLDFFKN